MNIKLREMKGIRYVTDDKNRKVAIQIDLDKYGELVEDLLDVVESEVVKAEETITLEELKEELKKEGKL